MIKVADEDEKTDELDAEVSGESAVARESGAEALEVSDNGDGVTPAQLGATKYVQAAFFGAGILGAFLIGKILTAVWNALASWPAAVGAVPQLLSYAEDERATFTMSAGAVIALIVVIRAYNKEDVRRWADEVAAELSKVVWPNKETVTNGTIVVIVASLIATVYIGLLDRFWGFVTNLVYGA